MKFQPPRGTRDFLPEEMVKREYVIQTIKKIFESYGFDALETPVFEEWQLLIKKSGEDIKKQIYYFKDKADRELGLRFDLTVPLARVVANNPQLPKPFKRYAISPVWRYEEITAARKREFYQCDIDVVGSSSMDADVECIACAVDCLKALGFKDFVVRINNRKVLDGFIELIDADRKRDLDVFRTIDKLEKFGLDAVRRELKDILDENQIKKLVELVAVKGDFNEVLEKSKNLLKGINIGEEGLKELQDVFSIVKEYGISNLLKLDLSVARGLDYYTGSIFEIVVKGYEKFGSIAAGGRYDNLIEIFGGRDTPATGISLGIERIIEILKSEDKLDFPKTKVKMFVANVNNEVKKDSIKIAQVLRKNGLSCQTDLMNRTLVKQLEYADSLEIPYVIIVGKKEIESKRFKLKDMKKKTEKELSMDEIISLVKSY